MGVSGRVLKCFAYSAMRWWVAQRACHRSSRERQSPTPNWTITVNNKSKTPADVTILLNGSKVGDKKSAGANGSTTISIPPKPGNYSWKAESGGKECGKELDLDLRKPKHRRDLRGLTPVQASGFGRSAADRQRATVPARPRVAAVGVAALQGTAGGARSRDIGKDGCPSRTVQDLRKLRER